MGASVTKWFCDWCEVEVFDDRELHTVPFMNEGYPGEKVCPDCEKTFTRHYKAARAERKKVPA